MANKIIGYLFVFLGVIIILWGLWFSFEIFKGEKPAPELFKTQLSGEKKEVSIPGIDKQMQEQISGLLKNQLGDAISPESINKILNLSSWFIFMTILVLACGKISLIGVQLIKTDKGNV
jgi:hypothetical protein